jgi:hypothetical protein
MKEKKMNNNNNNNNITTTNSNGRRTNLQILEDKRSELGQGLIDNKQFLDVIPANKQEQFRKNFLELATQDYLLSIVDTKELVRFAVNVTKTGLDIAPASKEVYIIPFDTKVNGNKIMLPQAIIPLNGMQQLAYQKGFFLLLDAVWKFDDGTCEAESKLTRLQQAQLQTATSKWVDTHFIGFDVVLTDLENKLPTQVKFVDLNYVREATKTIKDERWKIQTWRHKAVRRAYGDFMIPRERKIEAFEEIEQLNDSILASVDVSANNSLTLEIENAIKQLGLKLSKNNGVAKVEGVQLSHYKTLKALGFDNINNQWVMDCEYVIESTPTATTTQTGVPAKTLYKILLSKGMTKEEIGNFVGDFLGLNKDDDNKINEYLNDEELLDKSIAEFVGLNNGTTDVPEDLF